MGQRNAAKRKFEPENTLPLLVDGRRSATTGRGKRQAGPSDLGPETDYTDWGPLVFHQRLYIATSASGHLKMFSAYTTQEDPWTWKMSVDQPPHVGRLT